MDAFTGARFGRFAVEPARRALLVDGQPAKIGARAFDLLMALIERRERVVSKDELLALVWPGVTVEESNLQVQIGALRKHLGADVIATIAGRGYQFTGALEAPPLAAYVAAPHLARRDAPPSKPNIRRLASVLADWRIRGAGLAVLLLLAAGGAWIHQRRPLPTGNPTIAIMPFADLGGDAASERFAKGIVAGIETDFSRLRDLGVIASAVAASAGAKDADVRKVAADLDVRFVLTGTVQREGDRLQASAQLLDGTTGATRWSNRWARPADADALAFQNDVADEIASTLGSRNFLMQTSIAAAQAKAPADRTAYDLFALGYENYIKGTAQGFADSLPLFDAAIAKNPRLTFAYVMRGWSTWLLAVTDTSKDYSAALDEAERLARAAIAIDPADAEPHVLLGDRLTFKGHLAEAAAEIDKALRLDPSSSDILVKSALGMSYFGRPEQGAALCDKAYRLNPLGAPFYAIHCFENYFFMGRYQDAIALLNRSESWKTHSAYELVYLVAAQAENGDAADAATVAALKRDDPGVTAEGMGFIALFVRAQERDKLVAALRKAGAPLCVPADKAADLPKAMHLSECDAERSKAAAR